MKLKLPTMLEKDQPKISFKKINYHITLLCKEDLKFLNVAFPETER